MQINPSIFKSYDIRGIYSDTLTDEVAYRIGRAYITLIQSENQGKQLTILVSRDVRLSSQSLSQNLIKGLIDQGANVVDIGLASTPTMYAATSYFGHDGGIQVTASHNPKEHNGFKMVRAHAVPVSGETGITFIRDLVIKNVFSSPANIGHIETKTNVLPELLKSQQNEWQVDLDNIKPFKIVIDAANAMGILDYPEILADTPCELIKLNFELDGNFPAHQPDPLDEKNLIPLQEAVKQYHADLGIAPDGDGDRVFFVDNNGDLIRQEILRGLIAQIVLKKFPGSTVCYDIRPGRITRDMIEAVGGKAVVTKVGHSLIKEQMIRENSPFSGESSGHYFFRFSYGSFESPAMLVWQFLNLISTQNKPVSDIIAPYKIYFHSGEINSTVADPKAKIEEIKVKYADGQINLLDGVTIEFIDWWFNVRASNTEPLLRLNLEAKTQKLMEEKRDEVLALIRS